MWLQDINERIPRITNIISVSNLHTLVKIFGFKLYLCLSSYSGGIQIVIKYMVLLLANNDIHK